MQKPVEIIKEEKTCRVTKLSSLSCRGSPLTVRAQEFDLTPVSSPKKIIVIGGGLVGAETADYLAVYGGRKVTILEMKPAIVADGEPNPNHFLLRSLRDHNVDVFVNTSISEIAEDGVHFTLDGEEHFVKEIRLSSVPVSAQTASC